MPPLRSIFALSCLPGGKVLVKCYAQGIAQWCIGVILREALIPSPSQPLFVTYLFFFFEARFHYAFWLAWNSLCSLGQPLNFQFSCFSLLMLLQSSCLHWDYRHEPPHLAFSWVLFSESKLSFSRFCCLSPLDSAVETLHLSPHKPFLHLAEDVHRPSQGFCLKFTT